MPRRALSGAIGSAIVALLVAAPPRQAAPGTASVGPNLVIILTDDQRWDTLWAMPNVQSELVDRGITFTRAFAVNPLCCPSRTSILTGQYSHSTMVYGNSGTYGGFHHFQDDSTLPVWLQQAGYHTGLVGKYLNEYDVNYIPPGWDRWVSFLDAESGGAYYDYTLTEDGTLVTYGHTDTDYSTDILTGHADAFIRETPADQPLFLYFAPFAPHTPSTPATKYSNAFEDLQRYRPPNYNEADVSDKPAWVRKLPLLSRTRQGQIDNSRKNQYRTLLSVDDAVDTIVAALTDTGRLADTMIVFMGDNGWSLGEHRWNNKKVAWEESARVPFVLRYDPLIPSGRIDGHLVANIDVAPTLASVAGVEAPGVEGMDLTPLIDDPQLAWRHELLIEHLGGDGGLDPPDVTFPVPTFCAVRDDGLQSQGFLYVVYRTGEEELYDLKADLFELDNVAGTEAYADAQAALRTEAKLLCDPPPPGFEWPYSGSAAALSGPAAPRSGPR